MSRSCLALPTLHSRHYLPCIALAIVCPESFVCDCTAGCWLLATLSLHSPLELSLSYSTPATPHQLETRLPAGEHYSHSHSTLPPSRLWICSLQRAHKSKACDWTRRHRQLRTRSSCLQPRSTHVQTSLLPCVAPAPAKLLPPDGNPRPIASRLDLRITPSSPPSSPLSMPSIPQSMSLPKATSLAAAVAGGETQRRVLPVQA